MIIHITLFPTYWNSSLKFKQIIHIIIVLDGEEGVEHSMSKTCIDRNGWRLKEMSNCQSKY